MIEGEANSGENVDTHYQLTLFCDAEIEGGTKHCQNGLGTSGPAGFNKTYKSCRIFAGSGDNTYSAKVTPEWPGSSCWVAETHYASAVESVDDCGSLTISHGHGDGCRVTNSIFYEGIPALGKYGMAIFALLMLGVGFAGFRSLA